MDELRRIHIDTHDHLSDPVKRRENFLINFVETMRKKDVIHQIYTERFEIEIVFSIWPITKKFELREKKKRESNEEK